MAGTSLLWSLACTGTAASRFLPESLPGTHMKFISASIMAETCYIYAKSQCDDRLEPNLLYKSKDQGDEIKAISTLSDLQ